MMRTIKFRGIAKGLGWIYGDLVRSGSPESPDFGISYWDEESGWMYADVIEKSIGQYTGMNDRDGREIYEGDRVRVVRKWRAQGSEDRRTFGVFTAVWNDNLNGFGLDDGDGRCYGLIRETRVVDYVVVEEERAIHNS